MSVASRTSDKFGGQVPVPHNLSCFRARRSNQLNSGPVSHSKSQSDSVKFSTHPDAAHVKPALSHKTHHFEQFCYYNWT